MRKLPLMLLVLWMAPALSAETATEGALAAPLDWRAWTVGNETRNVASLQRGARNYMGYCLGCHSLKYLRYSRMAEDLKIPPEQLSAYLLPEGSKPTDYITTSMPVADSTTWYGKEPPDLSLIALSRSPDYLFRFLKTFYVDPSAATQVNNLQLENAAMPAVLSSLEGVKQAVFRDAQVMVEGKPVATRVFDHFEMLTPGSLTPAQYDEFLRDTVNFLDYASDPTQVKRRDIGIWVVLFLLVFTWLAWLLKQEYWKDVH